MPFLSRHVQFLTLSYGNCFPSYHRHSGLLKIQKCSRAAQNALGGRMRPAGRRLPTPNLGLSVPSLKRHCCLQHTLIKYPHVPYIPGCCVLFSKSIALPNVSIRHVLILFDHRIQLCNVYEPYCGRLSTERNEI